MSLDNIDKAIIMTRAFRNAIANIENNGWIGIAADLEKIVSNIECSGYSIYLMLQIYDAVEAEKEKLK
jgi:hypothetical protein